MPRLAPISGKRLRRLFEKAGYRCVRIEGDHFVLTKPGIPRPLVIPDWDTLPVFIVRNNLRTAGMDRDEYFRLLRKV